MNCQILEGIVLRGEGESLKKIFVATFFIQRLGGVWNAQPGEVWKLETLTTFKRLNRHVNMQGMEGYRPHSSR